MAAPPLLYPFTLGMLAAVNPCGFPLLPAYLELFVGGQADDDGAAARAGRAVTASACATTAFLVLFGALGLVTQAGWSALAGHSASAARYVMVVVAAAMVAAGAWTLAGRSIRLKLPELGTGRGRSRPVALALFGLSYGVASIGCALPLFISGVSATFDRSGILRGTGGLIAYGLGMGAVFGALALGIALLGRGAARGLRRVSRLVPIVGGAVLVVTGAYLLWYWIVDIVSPGRSFAAQRLVNRIQVDVSNPLDAHATLFGALLGAAVIVAVVAAGLRSGGRPRPADGAALGSATSDRPGAG